MRAFLALRDQITRLSLLRGKMKPDGSERLLGAIDAVVEQVGATSYEDAVARALAALKVISFFVGRTMEALEKAKHRDQLVAMIAKGEKLDSRQIDFGVAAIRALPHIVGSAVKKVSADASAMTPQASKGRPRISVALRRQVCSFIANLHYTKALALAVCKKRASQRFGISYRSAERIWGARAKTAFDLDSIGQQLATLFKKEFLQYQEDSLLKRQ
jgi:hypothetical protein